MATLTQYAVDNRINTGNTNLVIPASGTTAAAPFDCFGTIPIGLVIPSTWTSTTLTFKGLPYFASPTSADITNSDLVDIVDDSGLALEVDITTGGIYLPLSPMLFNGIRYLNVVSSAAQVAAATIKIAMAPLWLKNI